MVRGFIVILGNDKMLLTAFFEAIGEPLEHEDPSDRLLDVQTQIEWLRDSVSTTSTVAGSA